MGSNPGHSIPVDKMNLSSSGSSIFHHGFLCANLHKSIRLLGGEYPLINRVILNRKKV